MKVLAFSTALAMLSNLPAGSVCAVSGLPRTGKSNQVKAADASGAFPRRLVFDPYYRRDVIEARSRPDITPWHGQAVSPAELLMRRELLCWSPLDLVVAPEHLETEKLAADFTAVAELAWHAGGIDVICEEAALYTRQAADLVMRFASGGGHVNARLVLITQSIGRLHIDARKNLSHVITFAQGSPEDLLALRCGTEFADRVRKLRAPAPGRPNDPPELWRLGDALEAA
jgi:hypothetical protein